MKVSSITQYNKIYQNSYKKRTLTTQHNTNFEGINVDSFKISTLNPGKAYLNKLYDLSITVSKKSWISIIDDLKSYTKEIIQTKNKNTDFIAWDINKDNRKKYVIILHGLSHNITKLQDLYSGIINDTSYAVFAPEYKGFYETNIQKMRPSDNDYMDSVEKSYFYLKNKGIKDGDISILGHSMGAYVASKFVEKYPQVSDLILVAPINSLNYECELVTNSSKKRLSLNKYTKFFIKNFEICRKPFQKTFNLGTTLKNVKTNTHIIYAKNDKLINRKSIEELSDMCTNLKSFKILNSGGHKMNENKINAIVELLNSM